MTNQAAALIEAQANLDRVVDRVIAISDARMAISRSGAYTAVRQVRALNDAVRAGVVFG